MAFDSDSKTEAPTPRRLHEARQRGQVARSMELPAAVAMFLALLAMDWYGESVWTGLIGILQNSMDFAQLPASEGLLNALIWMGLQALWLVTPMLLMVVGGILFVQYIQVGLLFTLHPIEPNLNKINPVKGVQRLFSGRTLATTAINLLKLSVVGLVAYITLQSSSLEIAFAASLSMFDLISMTTALVFRLSLRLAAVLLLIALIDFAYQRYRHEKDLKMTKDEVKDEMRNMEGSPEIRRRRRQLQQQFALQRIRMDVPKADVIVTNPTHLAIAIRYDADTMSAPRVVAKGADHMAAIIRQIAMEHKVPIVQRRELARAMYDVVEPGDEVPERFFQAVAEILAYVYQLSGSMPSKLKKAM